MDTLGIGLRITIAHEVLYNLQAILDTHLRHLGHAVDALLLQLLPQQVGEIFRAINFVVLGHYRLIPHLARGQEGFIGNLVKILRTGQVQTLIRATAHHREIQRLRVDGKLMFTELDDILTIHIQLLLILELAYGLLVNALELTLDALRFAGLIQRLQFLHAFTDRINHSIASHVAVDVIDILKRPELVLNALEHAFGR